MTVTLSKCMDSYLRRYLCGQDLQKFHLQKLNVMAFPGASKSALGSTFQSTNQVAFITPPNPLPPTRLRIPGSHQKSSTRRSPLIIEAIYSAGVQNARRSLVMLASTGGSRAISETTLQTGMLVEFRKDTDRHLLVRIQEPNGRTNWWGVDQAGRRHNLQVKQITLFLPAGSYNDSSVVSFTAAAEAADMSLLELAWEIASEGGQKPLGLLEMSDLLFDARDAQSLYITHRMLALDRVYFKQVGKGTGLLANFEARPLDQVTTLLRQAELEAESKRDQQAFASAAAAAMSSSTTRVSHPESERVWTEGPHSRRISALMEVAMRPEASLASLPASSVALASESLTATGFKLGSSVLGLRTAATTFLMDIGVLRYHEPLELRRLGLSPSDLPGPLMARAQELLSSPPTDPATGHRRDLSHLSVYTIDDASTEEVDDALSVESVPSTSGSGLDTKLWIHVADPTRWLSPGDPLDLEARRRSRTLYMPWGYVPMFPKDLAKGPFGLNQGEVCNSISVGVTLSSNGSIADLEVVSTTINVTHRLTYDRADEILCSAAEDQVSLDLRILETMANLRRTYRERQGSLDIPLPEAEVHVPLSDLDSPRPRVAVERLSQSDSVSRGLVAEMMILAGEAIGQYGVREGLALPFRGQDVPTLPSSDEMQSVPEGPCRAYLLRSCMTRSTVTSKPQRHASLGLSAYVQFTSPIRRYSDVIAHFQVRAHLQGQSPPLSASAIDGILMTIQEGAKALGAVEREQTNYWLTEYFHQRPDKPWSAVVLGWFKEENRLAAVMIEELGWETITRVDRDLPVQPGDQLQLMLVESKAPGAEGAPAGPPRFTITGHSPHNEEDEEADGQ